MVVSRPMLRPGNMSPSNGNNRAASLQSVLWLLRDGRPRTTPELASLLGVAPSTALRLAQALHSSGFLSESAPAPRAPGRPAKCWQLRADAGYVLGLSTYPEEITAIVTDLCGAIKSRRSLRAETWYTAVSLPWAVGEVARAAMADAGVSQVLGAGIAMPGMVDPDAGLMRVGWHFRWSGSHVYDYPIREAFEQALRCPVALENDADACAIAAHLDAVATARIRPSDTLVYWLGLPRAPGWYGGLGITIGGAPYRGSHNAVGEFFHNLPQPVDEEVITRHGQRAMEGDPESARQLASALRPTLRFMLGIAFPLDAAMVMLGGSHTVLGAAMGDLIAEEMEQFRAVHEHIVPVACPSVALDPQWPNTTELGAARAILDRLILSDWAASDNAVLRRPASVYTG